MTKFLRAGEVAELLHMSPKSVSRWAKEGKIPSVKTIGGHRRFDPEVIGRMVRQQALFSDLCKNPECPKAGRCGGECARNFQDEQ